MKTPPPQTLRADMSPATRGDDRRQQTDRRRVSGRRETDQQQEESFQLDGIKNEQAKKTIRHYVAQSRSDRKKMARRADLDRK